MSTHQGLPKDIILEDMLSLWSKHISGYVDEFSNNEDAFIIKELRLNLKFLPKKHYGASSPIPIHEQDHEWNLNMQWVDIPGDYDQPENVQHDKDFIIRSYHGGESYHDKDKYKLSSAMFFVNQLSLTDMRKQFAMKEIGNIGAGFMLERLLNVIRPATYNWYKFEAAAQLQNIEKKHLASTADIQTAQTIPQKAL